MGIYRRSETGIYYLKIKEGSKYRCISLSTKNLAIAFVELAIAISKSNIGIVSFIIPKFWLLNLDNQSMRKYMLSNIDLISLSMSNPFKNVVTENVITFFL
ncbi:MAG: Eco57I restriction-modification methylase domain-containing protein [Brevinema sp.]